MEQQNHNQINKRINILMAVAGVAIIVGLVGLVIGLMKPTTQTTLPSSSTSAEGSLGAGSSYQEVINDAPDSGGTKKGTASNN
jgi:hypothetical protein